MKRLIKYGLILSIPVILMAAAYRPAVQYLKNRNRPEWRTMKVDRGSIIDVVNSTGTVKPKIQVSVGAFVSGPIVELPVEFNQEVKKGQVLARIDPTLYEANVQRDRASLLNRESDVLRAKAQLKQAINDEKRSIALRTEDPSFISQAEMDKFKFSRMSLEAQLQVAESSVEVARATLTNSNASLGYTVIKSPVDGIVINRKIDPGQTLASQFQTPELFIVAPDMRTEMHIHALVDEVDIGRVEAAQKHGYPVTFTVEAYENELFTGEILERRLSYGTTQNVVTYPVIVKARNPDLKLLPGMTASLSFQVDERQDVIRIPNAALRFFPSNTTQVREQDRGILEGTSSEFIPPENEETSDANQGKSTMLSANQRMELNSKRNNRYVWVQEGHLLRAVRIRTGLGDGQYTELLEGDLKPDDELVTGLKIPVNLNR